MANPASGWTCLKSSPQGATWRKRMTASDQTQPNLANFRPKPLTIEQENVIDCLILGKSEREAAEACHVNRATIAEWRKSPLFIATLNQRRQALWQECHEMLRALLFQGFAKLQDRIESMTTRELLQLVGLARDLGEPTGETDPARVAERMLLERLAAEGVRPNTELERLSNVLNPVDPAFAKRKAEILAELKRQYGED
jgi:hypothetical protein